MTANHNKLHDEIVRRWRKRLEAQGCMTVHLHSYTVRKIGWKVYRIPLMIDKGWPDIFCFRPDGSVEFFEIKTGNAKLNPFQVKRCAELMRMGFKVTLIKGPLMVKEVLKWKKEKN